MCDFFILIVLFGISQRLPGIPTTIKTMGVNITTIVYLRVLIIQIGSTIILMVVEAQGFGSPQKKMDIILSPQNEGGGTSPLLRNIAFCLTTCGLVAFFVGLFKQLGATKTVFKAS